MPPRLGPVLAKIIWAEEHLRSLNTEILTYLDVCKKIVELPTKINPHKNTLRLQFHPLPEPDWRISLRIGDCVHNARSSLDHLWKRLRKDGNFPMIGRNDGEDGWLALRAGILKGIPVDAHAIIDALQPCNLGDRAQSHPLAILNKLAKIDKHETIHLTKPRSHDTTYTFTDQAGTVVHIIKVPLVLHDETEIVIHGVPDEVCQPNVYVNINGTLFVSFKESGPWEMKPVQEVLYRCIDFVKTSVMVPLRPFIR